ETDPKVVRKKLSAKGATLFETLLPLDLRTLLWSLRERIRTVQIQSDDPWIPWEFVKLYGKEKERTVEGPFLCEAFSVTRWIPGVARQLDLKLKQMAIVVP